MLGWHWQVFVKGWCNIGLTSVWHQSDCLNVWSTSLWCWKEWLVKRCANIHMTLKLMVGQLLAQHNYIYNVEPTLVGNQQDIDSTRNWSSIQRWKNSFCPLQKSVLMCSLLNFNHVFKVILIVFSFVGISRDVIEKFIIPSPTKSGESI